LRWLRSGRVAAAPANTDPVSAKRRANEQAERNPEAAAGGAAVRRLISLRADEPAMEFNARLGEATSASARGNMVERMAALRAFAVTEAGETQADSLLAMWLLLDDTDRRLEALDFGDVLQFGHVLNRWINRPSMVPFPEKLSAEEKKY